MSKKRPLQGYKLKPTGPKTGESDAQPAPTRPQTPPKAKPAAQGTSPSSVSPAAPDMTAQDLTHVQEVPVDESVDETTRLATSEDFGDMEEVEVDDSPASEQGDFVTPKWEHSLVDVATEPVDERDLTGLMRDWRRGRATKTIGQVLSDGYVTIFAIVMIVAMLGGAVWRGQAQAAACTTTTCTVGRTLLPWVAMGAMLCLTALASRVFGPVVASAAEGFWLMEAPIRRGRLLWKRFVGVVVATGLIAAALGGLLAALTGYDLTSIVQWALAMGIGAAGLTALAGLEQTYGRTWIITILQWVFGLVAIGILAVIVSVAADWFGWTLPQVPSNASVIWVAVAGGVLLLVGGGFALSRLGRIHRARLVSGGNLVSGMQGAAFAMDIGLMRDILVERDSMRKGHVRPARGHFSGGTALVWREIQRLWRYPKRLLLVVVSVVVPYAVAALGFHDFSPFISALILLVGFVPLLGSMRVMTRTKGLARTLPLSNSQIRRAMAVVPAGVAVLWAVAAAPAFWGIGTPDGQHYMALGQAFAYSCLTAAAGLLAAIRWVTAKSADYSKPMMQTGFGALPPGLMFNLFRGLDVAVLISGPLLLHWTPWISAVLAGIVAFVLSGAYNMEEMQAMQAEMEKEKAKAKGGLAGAGGAVTKKTITPPKGRINPPQGRR